MTDVDNVINNNREGSPSSMSSYDIPIPESQESSDVKWNDGEDDAFRQLFHMRCPNDELDPTALLACKRVGVEPLQLLAVPKPETRDRTTSIRYTAAVSRRIAKVGMVEAEKENIIRQLHSRFRHRTRGALAVEIGSSPNGNSKNSSQLARQQQELMEEEIKKYKQKEMRHVMSQRDAELKRCSLQQQLQQRERHRQASEQQKKRFREKESRHAHHKRTERIFRARERTEIQFLEGRNHIEQIAACRTQRSEEHLKLKILHNNAKKEKMRRKMSIVQRRNNELVIQRTESDEIRKNEIDVKLSNHDSRRSGVNAKKKGQTQIRQHIHSARVHLMEQYVANNTIKSEQLRERLIAKQADTEERAIELEQLRQHQRDLNKEVLNNKLSRVKSNLTKDKQRVSEAHAVLAEKAIIKLNYLKRLEQDKEDNLHFKREQSLVKQETMRDNKQRIQQQLRHHALVQAIKVDEDIKKKANLDRKRRAESVKREIRRQETDASKRAIQTEIHQLMRLQYQAKQTDDRKSPELEILPAGRLLPLEYRPSTVPSNKVEESISNSERPHTTVPKTREKHPHSSSPASPSLTSDVCDSETDLNKTSSSHFSQMKTRDATREILREISSGDTSMLLSSSLEVQPPKSNKKGMTTMEVYNSNPMDYS